MACQENVRLSINIIYYLKNRIVQLVCNLLRQSQECHILWNFPFLNEQFCSIKARSFQTSHRNLVFCYGNLKYDLLNLWTAVVLPNFVDLQRNAWGKTMTTIQNFITFILSNFIGPFIKEVIILDVRPAWWHDGMAHRTGEPTACKWK